MSNNSWSPQVARAMREFGEAAPLPPSLGDVRARPTPAPQRRMAVPIAAALLVVAGVVGTFAVLARDAATPASGSPLMVQHLRYEVSWDAQLECDTPMENPAAYQSVVIDTWSDRTGRQWRQQLTYPDGTTRDVILRGSAVYPTEQFERGEVRDSALGCVSADDDPYILVAGPSLPYFVTLAPELSPDERPYVRLYNDDGSVADVEALDSQGRPSQRWTLRVGGTAGYNELAQFPVTQVTTWWVDPIDGETVLQRTVTQDVETLGAGSRTETLVLQETITAPDDLFATNGFTEVGTTPRPELDDEGTETTVITTASLFDTGAAMIIWVAPGASADQLELIRGEILRSGVVDAGGLRYLDADASLAEAQRALADDGGVELLDESNVPTMFQLFPADPGTFDPEQWRESLLALPNVLRVDTPDDEQPNIVPPPPGAADSSLPTPDTTTA